MAKKYVTGSRLKKTNLSDIFMYILEKGSTTRREIEYETGFSWGTVSANVALLIEKGYIAEEKSEKSGSVGRTTYVLRPSSDGVVSIGIDINRSGYTAQIIGLDLKLKKSLAREFEAQTQAELIAEAEELLDEAASFCADNDLRIFSLGIAMQGTVHGKKGISVLFPGIDGWKPINIKEYFSEKFGVSVYLGHDPKCMLLGEMKRSRAEDCVLIRADEGIGMAVALDGRILDDTERFELGHTVSVFNGRLCNCGKKGCLEAYASLEAVSRLSGDCVDKILAQPNKYEKELDEAGGYLGAAIYNSCVLFKPKRLVLTGVLASVRVFSQAVCNGIGDICGDICIDPDISAAYGAAAEAVRTAVKAFNI